MSLHDAVTEWTEIRGRSMEMVLDAGAVSVAVIHGAAVLDSGPTISDVHARSALPSVSEWVGRLQGRSVQQSEVCLGSRGRRFVEAAEDPVLGARPGELHLGIYDGDRFVGRILACSAKSSSVLRRRLNAIAPPLRKQLVDADRRLREATPNKPGFAILDANAEVRFADAIARAWLDVHAIRLSVAHELMQLAASGRRASCFSAVGTEARLGVLEGDGIVYLAELRPAQPLLLDAASHLTPMQRKVADFASTGSTVQEIACALAVAPDTVRTHLREIYRRLSVGNRVELSRAMKQNPGMC